MATALEVIPWGTPKRRVPEYDMVRPVNHVHRQIPKENPLGRGSSRIRTDDIQQLCGLRRLSAPAWNQCGLGGIRTPETCGT